MNFTFFNHWHPFSRFGYGVLFLLLSIAGAEDMITLKVHNIPQGFDAIRIKGDGVGEFETGGPQSFQFPLSGGQVVFDGVNKGGFMKKSRSHTLLFVHGRDKGARSISLKENGIFTITSNQERPNQRETFQITVQGAKQAGPPSDPPPSNGGNPIPSVRPEDSLFGITIVHVDDGDSAWHQIGEFQFIFIPLKDGIPNEKDAKVLKYDAKTSTDEKIGCKESGRNRAGQWTWKVGRPQSKQEWDKWLPSLGYLACEEWDYVVYNDSRSGEKADNLLPSKSSPIHGSDLKLKIYQDRWFVNVKSGFKAGDGIPFKSNRSEFSNGQPNELVIYDLIPNQTGGVTTPPNHQSPQKFKLPALNDTFVTQLPESWRSQLKFIVHLKNNEKPSYSLAGITERPVFNSPIEKVEVMFDDKPLSGHLKLPPSGGSYFEATPWTPPQDSPAAPNSILAWKKGQEKSAVPLKLDVGAAIPAFGWDLVRLHSDFVVLNSDWDKVIALGDQVAKHREIKVQSPEGAPQWTADDVAKAGGGLRTTIPELKAGEPIYTPLNATPLPVLVSAYLDATEFEIKPLRSSRLGELMLSNYEFDKTQCILNFKGLKSPDQYDAVLALKGGEEISLEKTEDLGIHLEGDEDGVARNFEEKRKLLGDHLVALVSGEKRLQVNYADYDADSPLETPGVEPGVENRTRVVFDYTRFNPYQVKFILTENPDVNAMTGSRLHYPQGKMEVALDEGGLIRWKSLNDFLEAAGEKESITFGLANQGVTIRETVAEIWKTVPRKREDWSSVLSSKVTVQLKPDWGRWKLNPEVFENLAPVITIETDHNWYRLSTKSSADREKEGIGPGKIFMSKDQGGKWLKPGTDVVEVSLGEIRRITPEEMRSIGVRNIQSYQDKAELERATQSGFSNYFERTVGIDVLLKDRKKVSNVELEVGALRQRLNRNPHTSSGKHWSGSIPETILQQVSNNSGNYTILVDGEEIPATANADELRLKSFRYQEGEKREEIALPSVYHILVVLRSGGDDALGSMRKILQSMALSVKNLTENGEAESLLTGAEIKLWLMTKREAMDKLEPLGTVQLKKEDVVAGGAGYKRLFEELRGPSYDDLVVKAAPDRPIPVREMEELVSQSENISLRQSGKNNFLLIISDHPDDSEPGAINQQAERDLNDRMKLSDCQVTISPVLDKAKFDENFIKWLKKGLSAPESPTNP